MTFPAFDDFFRELNRTDDGQPLDPFPWQRDLAQRAVAGDWPEFIAAPTGSGKTACLEAAVYALASQAQLPSSTRTASRRIFFIVNRRVIVDEAFERASRIARALADPDASRPACAGVAEALLSLNPAPSGKNSFLRRPLECVQLRGAIFRDQRWVRSLLQPTIIATTIDQIGSRMLFRGYGVTPNARPIHAALVATDALWILDEAHISRPFAESVAQLQHYREHHLAQNPSAIQPPPLRWVQMTATPPENESNLIQLTAADREHPVLALRLNAPKPAKLIVSEAKTKAKQLETLAANLVDQAAAIIGETEPRSLAIMVNRVATARLVTELLEKEAKARKPRFSAKTTLLIGRMRPIDRDAENARIQAALKTAARREAVPEGETAPPVEIVVATQCLEVGADLDFDALITECASLDALRQRFGRLNRTGRDIPARAAIVMPDHLIETDDKKLDKLTADEQSLDPIYGNALSATWNWLRSNVSDGTIDFGLTNMTELLKQVSETDLLRLQAPTSAAPVIFPAYLDAWAQTNPTPWPDPDPAHFLHGKRTGSPDVLVVWRADLSLEAPLEGASHDLSLCPPSQVEALPVPLHLFRNWFFQENPKERTEADTGDLLEGAVQPDGPRSRYEKTAPIGRAVLWQGARNSRFVEKPADLFPGATIVLPVELGGWSQLGHLPKAPPDPAARKEKDDPIPFSELRRADKAEEAFAVTRNRAILRLHPKLFSDERGGDAWKMLLDYARDPDQNIPQRDLQDLFNEAASEENNFPDGLQKTVSMLARSKFNEERYFDETGLVFTTRQRLKLEPAIAQAEDEDDEWSRSGSSAPVTLRTHTRHVADLVALTAKALNLEAPLTGALVAAAELHDWGKLDPRFQALLLGGNRHAAFALAEPLAKSDRLRSSAREREAARKRSGLPAWFRHEFASLHLATHSAAAGCLPANPDLRDLALHLIAAHHGYARPFAPVVDDPDPPPLSASALPNAPEATADSLQRKENPPHRLDSGVPDRFWKLLRQHGPWGLAFLETILRLADQQASEAEGEGWYAAEIQTAETAETVTASS